MDARQHPISYFRSSRIWKTALFPIEVSNWKWIYFFQTSVLLISLLVSLRKCLNNKYVLKNHKICSSTSILYARKILMTTWTSRLLCNKIPIELFISMVLYYQLELSCTLHSQWLIVKKIVKSYMLYISWLK